MLPFDQSRIDTTAKSGTVIKSSIPTQSIAPLIPNSEQHDILDLLYEAISKFQLNDLTCVRDGITPSTIGPMKSTVLT